MRKHAAPLIAALFLLLPVLYVGSYLALVVPQGRPMSVKFRTAAGITSVWKSSNYRCDGQWPAKFFWPLEQIDRKVRPQAWGLNFYLDPLMFH